MNPNQNKRPLVVVLVVLIVALLVIVIFLLISKQTPVPISDNKGGDDGLLTNVSDVRNQTPTLPVPTHTQPISIPKYEDTPESKVISENSLTYLTGFEKRADGYYYFTLDYVTYNQNSGFVNSNPKLRTFKVNNYLRVGLNGDGEPDVSLVEYLTYLQKQNGIYQRTTTVQGFGPNNGVYHVSIQNGLIINFSEPSDEQVGASQG